jgi:UDP-N-acetylmuramyl pentapeptide synthase
MNILCCVAVLSELNLNLKKINNFFKTLNFLEGRGKINKVNKCYKSFF